MSSEILIIDDNPDIRNIIKDLIDEAGFKTRVAANYNQALAEIDKKLPDVAIIDVKLDKGDNDGLELLSHIKSKNKDKGYNTTVDTKIFNVVEIECFLNAPFAWKTIKNTELKKLMLFYQMIKLYF